MAPFVAPPDFNAEIDSNYHYVPTRWISMMFIVLYGISTAAHLIQATYYRMWFLLLTAVLAGLGEVGGWSNRYWSSFNDGINDTAFSIQFALTIIAPTPLLAAYFVIIGRLIDILGPQYSLLNRRYYVRIFTTADIIALFTQTVGASMTNGLPLIGGYIMLGAIAFQLLFLVTFVILSTDFILRCCYDRPYAMRIRAIEDKESEQEPTSNKHISRSHRFLLGGMAFSLTCLFIRAVYRTVELADGWNGRIIATQAYFNVLDGMMIVLAIWALNVFHPGRLLKKI